MIDHSSVNVRDFEKSKSFYQAALGSIGHTLLAEVPPEINLGGVPAAGFGGDDGNPEFWIGLGDPGSPPAHVAFRVSSRAMVDAFYAAALAAGGTDNGAPGLRPNYHASYYAAFVRDPDGHNIEAVCHTPES
jgi:catechol 2,3-dioxygenase-like lactoylglutathione lyase family enzyme